MRVGIIGAGVAGLCAALELHREHEVVVYERESVAGGKMRSQHLDGFLFEWGPNGFLSGAAELRAKIETVGITGELLEADPAAAKRYIYWNGALHALPQKPPQVLATKLLSLGGKLRGLRELFLRPQTAACDGESVSEFFERHFGREVAARIVAPALLGMSAGDARATSVDAAFPKLREFERETGSVLKAAMRNRPAERAKMLSFGARGMQRFAEAATVYLGDRMRFDTAVERVDRDDASWRVAYAGGEGRFDAVVIAAPSYAAAPMLASFDSELARLTSQIRYAPMRVAGVAFHASDVPAALDGFGFLAARDQGVRILGALYSSTMYPDQAPKGVAYLRIFMGGAADPAIVEMPEDEAKAIVLRDLQTTLGISAPPVAYHEVVWPQAIPQYGLDHPALIAAVDARLARYSRLALIGNAYRGLGVGDTARIAVETARRLAGVPA